MKHIYRQLMDMKKLKNNNKKVMERQQTGSGEVEIYRGSLEYNAHCNLRQLHDTCDLHEDQFEINGLITKVMLGHSTGL